MQIILTRVRWFFTGVRVAFPFALFTLWTASRKSIESIVEYWKNSQEVVNELAEDYVKEAYFSGAPTEYDHYVFWVCYSLACFLFLVGWLINAWLIVAAFEFLVSRIF